MSKLNPVDEYLSKYAADPQTGWGPALRNAAVQTGVGLAVAGAPIAATKIYQAVKKRGNFNSMLENNSDLQALHRDAQSDPAKAKQFNAFYDSLHRMNPEYAADPFVAGSYMRKMTNTPATAGGVLVDARNSAKLLPSGPLTETMRGMAGGIGKSVADGTRPMNPEPAPPAPPPLTDNDRMKQNIDDVSLQMKHDQLMQDAHAKGYL